MPGLVKKGASARVTALKVLELVINGAHVQETLNNALNLHPLPAHDAQLCSDLVYGCLRFYKRLDFILAQVLPKPGKLPEKMRIILIMGVYSLIFQGKIPDYAAINETVGQIKKMFGSPLAKVANGAMRSIQRLGEKILDVEWYSEKLGETWRGIFMFYGIPAAAGFLWLKAYGEQNTRQLLKRSGERPWKGLRINASHPDATALLKAFGQNPAQKEKIGDFGFAFSPEIKMPDIMGHDLQWWHEKGAISWQSPGSMQVMEKLGLFAWEKPVWDACAGSGIKSASLVERQVNVLLASDISAKRLRNIHAFFRRLNLPAPVIARADAARPPVSRWRGNILADVPCSGLGILARRPDIRFNMEKDGFWLQPARLQLQILNNLLNALGEGGQLAYITCTLNPQENERIIEQGLKMNRAVELARQWQTPFGHPWLEGMYGALLIKKYSGMHNC